MARFDNTPPPSRLKGNALATLVRIFVLAAFLVTAVQSSAFAANLTIQVANFSGQTIHYLYCKRSDVDDWGNDILRANQVLKHGESITIDFGENHAAYYDLRVVWVTPPLTGEDRDASWGGIFVPNVSVVRIGSNMKITYLPRS